MTILGLSVWIPVALAGLSLVVFGAVAWLVQERVLREDIEDQRPDGWPAARFAASAELRAPVKLHDTVKSVKRHLRRHGKKVVQPYQVGDVYTDPEGFEWTVTRPGRMRCAPGDADWDAAEAAKAFGPLKLVHREEATEK